MKSNLLKIINACILLSIVFGLPQAGMAQETKRRWQRGAAVQPDLQLFHSTQVSHLQTAETLQKDDFQFEIAHRFNTPISSGVGELYGLDGTASMRIALGYAITNHWLATLGRSNRDGNIDFRLKYKALQWRNDTAPVLVAVQAGMAYNGKPFPDVSSGDRYQYYGQLIVNTLIAKKWGIGLVPSYLYNSHIYCTETQDTFTFGLYLQHYLNEHWSFTVEANPTVTGWRKSYNALAVGVEIETGGHFFKMIVGNSTAMNPAQFLAGAPDSFSSGDWHFGFNITRLLKF